MKRLTGPALAVLLVPVGASANSISYNYLEAGPNWVDPPGRFGSSDTGLLLRGQGFLDDTIFLRGQFQSHRFDFRPSPGASRETLSRDLLWGGAGFRVPSQQQDLDFYGALDVGYDFGDRDEAGFRMEGGIWAFIEPGWDSAAGLRFWRLDDDSNVQVFGRGYYEVAPQLSLGGELAVGDFDELLLGVRYSF